MLYMRTDHFNFQFDKVLFEATYDKRWKPRISFKTLQQIYHMDKHYLHTLMLI